MMVVYSARSHVGRVREKNEDNLFADGVTLTADMRHRPFAIDGSASAPVVLAVCDGMGGEENGEVASMIAVGLLAERSEQIKSCSSQRLSKMVQNYVNAVNADIHSSVGNTSKRVGTTLALALATESGVYCFNIGDTRIYCLKSDGFAQVTNDHTLVAEKVRSGIISAEQARHEKDRHKLTRCIGIGEGCVAESYLPIRGKCRLLICSDGLTDMVMESEIEKVLVEAPRTADAVNALLDSALEHGGRDNVTIIVIDATAPPRFIRDIAQKLRKWRRV